jgi:hypothetical protein
MSIKVIIAAHIESELPTDELYLPLHVGAQIASPLPYVGDNTGDHISEKNATFCELTGLYWAWKNLPDEYVGLVHYRRYLALRAHRGKDPLKDVLTYAQAEKLLEGRDGILPTPRRYVIETLYSHYKHTSYIEPLDIAGEIIAEKYPSYTPAFERLKTRTSAHMFNMFVMKKEHFDGYCEFLFDVLFKLEQKTSHLEYDAFHARFFGRISELLLDVYLNTNGIKYTEYPFVYMEKVNLFKKGLAFLMAKFFGKKYGKSF